jgi:UDP-N-acetylglucosamine--N-acetylmuramyl-(pentapeptide) pyrophosphoryl-undecaprenol N-acetylglucosamine transferase
MSVPIVLHEANSIPGKVNRYLSSWAEVTAVHFPETQHLLKGPSVEVGMPLRDGFRHASIPREEAIRHFGLDPERKTLLVFGGSQGATSINRLVEGAVGQLNLQNFQILHIAGDVNILDELETFYATKNIRACVKPFENRMELAWQAAHIVICRAGAGAVAEQMEFEVPGILIPFPHAADNHQEHNADFMCATVGGAVKLLEKDLTASRLAACISDLWNDQEGILTRMQQAMQHYKKRARSRDLCALIKDYLLSY